MSEFQCGHIMGLGMCCSARMSTFLWYVNGELNMLILLKEIFDKQDSTHQCSFLLRNFFHAQNSVELQKDNISFGVTIYQ